MYCTQRRIGVYIIFAICKSIMHKELKRYRRWFYALGLDLGNRLPNDTIRVLLGNE